jgi:hypothetical protein
MKDNVGCLASVLAITCVLIVGPVLYYFCGWLTGVILQWLIGDTVINGMNYLFNTNRFTVDMLPTICGTLGIIGSFFKSRSSSK